MQAEIHNTYMYYVLLMQVMLQMLGMTRFLNVELDYIIHYITALQSKK